MADMVGKSGFFRPGGTLPPGSESYVRRRADDEIVDALIRGEFVFVLDSRQKGKSSLIVRSLARLAEHGVTTLRIDLQRLGTNLPPEQWYAGLLHLVGQELGLTGLLFEYWQANAAVGPLARWFGAVEDVVLPAILGPVVVFVDEIDFVKALPFSADEFFAAIRECYNRRATQPSFSRLTFCLAGVATPSQLIRNEVLTPFNVGRRIDLTDFTRQEINPYAAELSDPSRDGARLLDRIHHWVSGHPYLTQLLAAQIAADPNIRRPGDVDALVRRTLLSVEARQREPNLADVERRLLQASLPGASPEEARSRVLEAYRLLLRQGMVSRYREDPLISTFLLSGVAEERAGVLRIRNRLYRALFDERWRQSGLPHAEVRRQKAAAARAFRKAAWIWLTILGLVTALFAWALVATRQRDRAFAESGRLNLANRKLAYEASTALASERIQDGGFEKAVDLLESQRGSPDRGWEWYFLAAELGKAKILRPPLRKGKAPLLHRAWRQEGELVEIRGTDVLVDGRVIAQAPEGRLLGPFVDWLLAERRGAFPERLRKGLAIFGKLGPALRALDDDGRTAAFVNVPGHGIDVLELTTGRRIRLADGQTIRTCTLSHGGRYLLALAGESAISLYDLKTKRCVWHAFVWQAVRGQFSPDDRLVAVVPISSEVPIFRTRDGSKAMRWAGHAPPAMTADWSEDGKSLLIAGFDGTARLWSLPDGRLSQKFVGGGVGFTGATLNQRPNSVLATGRDGSLLEWERDVRPPVQVVPAFRTSVLSIRLSPDGRRCLATSRDGACALLDVRTGKPVWVDRVGPADIAPPAAFSPDGRILLLVAADGTALFADAGSGRILRRLSWPGAHPLTAAFSSTGGVALPLDDGRLVGLTTWQAAPRIRPSAGVVFRRLAFTRDGRTLAAGAESGDVALFDFLSMRLRRRLGKTEARVLQVEVSPDGRWLSVTTLKNLVHLFALDGSGRDRVLTGHESRVWQARFSPDGRKVLTTSFDDTARIWSVRTGAQLVALRHGSWVSAAEWSPDGRRVVTSCDDKFVRVFDANDGFELVKLAGHADSVLDVKFTPDGKTLVSGGGDCAVRFWRSEP